MPISTPVVTALILDDGVTAFTPTGGGVQIGYGKYSGAARIYDAGSATVAWKGVFAINPLVVDTSNGNETYTVIVEGCTSALFASGVQELGSINVGAVGQQQLLPLTNQVGTTIYSYMRAKFVAAGTTPSIRVLTFVQPLTGLDTLSLTELIQVQATIAQNQSNATANFSAWAVGTVTGGPNHDGKYPLTDFNGVTRLISCPAKNSSVSGGDGGLSAEEIAALLPMDVNGVAPNFPVEQGGVMRRFNFVPARQTKDLQDVTQTLNDEVYPAWSAAVAAANGGDGDVKVTRGQLSLGLTGMVFPWLFGCKGDVQNTSNVTTYAGSKVVTASEAIFKPSDVGKEAYLSNGRTGSKPFGGSDPSNRLLIEYYDSPTQVRVNQACATNFSTNQMYWGTNDTAGMEACLASVAPVGKFNLGGVVNLGGRMYLVDPQFYQPRSALIGPGGLVRRPGVAVSGVARTLLYNKTRYQAEYLRMDDFPTILNIKLDGMKYCQSCYTGSAASNCFEWISVTGAYNLPQIDPFVKFANIEIRDGSGIGYRDYGRGAGNLEMLSVTGCILAGIEWNHYDMAVTNVQSQNNGLAGIVQLSGGNTTYASVRSSYNGTGGNISPETTSNMVVYGHGCVWTNLMLQESFGPNLTIIGGNNSFSGQCQDTGDTFPVGEHGAIAKLPVQRAGVALKGFDCVENEINMKVGSFVHYENYATHALFFLEDSGAGRPTYNYGTMRYNHNLQGAWYNGGMSDGNTPIPAGAGVYAVNQTTGIGSQTSGTIHASNHSLTLNGTAVV